MLDMHLDSKKYENVLCNSGRYCVHIADLFRSAISANEVCDVFENLFSGNDVNVNQKLVRESRGLSLIHEFESGYKVVVRGYRRGGFMAKVTSQTFIRAPFSLISQTRPFWEFSVTEYLRNEGVSVPVIVGACIRLKALGVFYEGVLISVYVENSKNLLSFACELKDVDCEEYAMMAGHQASKMINAGVFHRDLHPANVLCVHQTKEIVLIDFDKAFLFQNRRDALALKIATVKRWNRSCNKHGLPASFQDAFKEGLFAESNNK